MHLVLILWSHFIHLQNKEVAIYLQLIADYFGTFVQAIPFRTKGRVISLKLFLRFVDNEHVH